MTLPEFIQGLDRYYGPYADKDKFVETMVRQELRRIPERRMGEVFLELVRSQPKHFGCPDVAAIASAHKVVRDLEEKSIKAPELCPVCGKAFVSSYPGCERCQFDPFVDDLNEYKTYWHQIQNGEIEVCSTGFLAHFHQRIEAKGA